MKFQEEREEKIRKIKAFEKQWLRGYQTDERHSSQFQDQQAPNRINTKETTPRYIKVKPMRLKINKTISKVSTEKNNSKNTTDFTKNPIKAQGNGVTPLKKKLPNYTSIPRKYLSKSKTKFLKFLKYKI